MGSVLPASEPSILLNERIDLKPRWGLVVFWSKRGGNQSLMVRSLGFRV